jgi:hypothetical protein
VNLSKDLVIPLIHGEMPNTDRIRGNPFYAIGDALIGDTPQVRHTRQLLGAYFVAMYFCNDGPGNPKGDYQHLFGHVRDGQKTHNMDVGGRTVTTDVSGNILYGVIARHLNIPNPLMLGGIAQRMTGSHSPGMQPSSVSSEDLNKLRMIPGIGNYAANWFSKTPIDSNPATCWDDDRDRTAIQAGIDLYDKHAPLFMNPSNYPNAGFTMQKALMETLKMWNIGHSRQK